MKLATPATGPALLIKRLLDIVVAAAGLLLLSPLIAALAVLVRAKLGRPVLFRQQRPGLRGEPFVLVKFRTMLDACDQNGSVLPDSERLTRFGRWLRSTSLDELPELWNVLKGDMSLVGPRPALFNLDDLVALRTLAGVERLRPGVTGWAQVNGRDELPIPDKVRFDAEYLVRHNLVFDLQIILETVKQALQSKGVSH